MPDKTLWLFRRFGIDTAYDPVIVYQLVEGIARQYPLGTVSYEYFVSQLGALAIYQFGHAFGREDRRGRFYDEEVSLFQEWDNRASRRLDRMWYRHGGFGLKGVGTTMKNASAVSGLDTARK